MRRGEIIPSVAAGLALLAGAPGPAHAAGYSEFLDSLQFRGFRAEASYTTDDCARRHETSRACPSPNARL